MPLPLRATHNHQLIRNVPSAFDDNIADFALRQKPSADVVEREVEIGTAYKSPAQIHLGRGKGEGWDC